LYLYRERFSSTADRSGGRSPISDSRDVSDGCAPVLLEVQPAVSDPAERKPICSPTNRMPPPEFAGEESLLLLEPSVLIHFTRTPSEFRHLLDTLAIVFPSLFLPRWPTSVLDKFPAELLPARQLIVAFMQGTLCFLAALDDVVSHECFLSFIDHSVCPRGKFHLMRVKRRLLDEEHPLGLVQLHDQALQPLTANAGKHMIAAAIAASNAGSGGGNPTLQQQLQTDTAFLRNLSATSQALQVECFHLRGKLQKELTDRQQRRKSSAAFSGSGGTANSSTGSAANSSSGGGGLLSSMFTSKLDSLTDLTLMIAKSGNGAKSLDELPHYASVRLGDRICSSAFGAAMTGTVAYLGPTPNKTSDRLVGVTWDEPLPFAVAAGNTSTSQQRPASPKSPGSTLGTGHWSGSADTGGGRFACRRDQGSTQLASQLFRDPCEDVTIAAILEACVRVDRCLHPPEVGLYGTQVLARNGSRMIGALIAVSNFEAAATLWCSRILTSYRTFMIAQHWLKAQDEAAATHSAATTSSSSQQQNSSGGNVQQQQFDVDGIRQHAKALGTSLSHCMTDFRSAWACYGAARRASHATVAERYVALVSLFDHVEPQLIGGSWLLTSGASLPSEPDGSSPSSSQVGPAPQVASRRAGQYGRGTLDGVLLEVDAELSHFAL
jgi:hypothetical protein